MIAYDVSSSRRRRLVRRILLEWRLDGQKSVHECLLSDVRAEELFLQLSAMIDPEADRLLMAWLAPRRRVLARGCGRPSALRQRVVVAG